MSFTEEEMSIQSRTTNIIYIEIIADSGDLMITIVLLLERQYLEKILGYTDLK
jgi:hypothetical protein